MTRITWENRDWVFKFHQQIHFSICWSWRGLKKKLRFEKKRRHDECLMFDDWLLSWQRLSNNNSVWGFHKLLLECFMCNLFLLMLMFLYRLLFFAHKVMRHGIYFTLKAECSFIRLMSYAEWMRDNNFSHHIL